MTQVLCLPRMLDEQHFVRFLINHIQLYLICFYEYIVRSYALIYSQTRTTLKSHPHR